jgi:dipeptidyl-peptidase 4
MDERSLIAEDNPYFRPSITNSMKRIILFTLLLVTVLNARTQQGLSNQLVWASGEFSAEYVDGLNPMRDGEHYTSLERSDAFGSRIVKYSYATGNEVAVLATSKDIFQDPTRLVEDYSFNADETKLLITTEMESIYRHSYSANFYVYDLKTKTTSTLADFSKGKQRLAEFSPDGKYVAFVRNNNLYVADYAAKKEIAITDDGEWNKIIHGAADWVYEEEFGKDKAFEWSPAGNRIAWIRTDESNVREYTMDYYGELYPEPYTFKYPKAGEENSKVSVWIHDLDKQQSRKVDTGSNPDIYIPRIHWSASNDRLVVMRMNRHQNHLEFLATDLTKTEPFDISVTTIYEEKADTYIDISDNLLFAKDGKTFYWTSERDDYNHLWQFDFTGKPVKQITSGAWDIIDLYGIDEVKGLVYYSSSTQGATQKHVYVTDLKKGKTKLLTPQSGTNDATFSTGMKFFILTRSDANTPPVTTLHTADGKQIRVLKDNAKLRERIGKYNLTKTEFFQFTNSSGDALNCWMMKPGNFDPAKKYPVLVAIYGGPGSNTVRDAWGSRNALWYQLLCQEGFIVVSCDPRGTMHRGRKFKHSTYMNLGKNETEDFIDFAKYLGQQSYIDSKRIGIQGWSYGGYMSSLCMTKGADYYAAGIAVAPVTNWKYYDSIYTERFMRTPQENNGGYENNSPINFVDLLKGKYLLVHGSADDNVHLQNTMDMVSALVAKNKPFDMFIYPNKNHGIYGGYTRLHLFEKMTVFLKENL